MADTSTSPQSSLTGIIPGLRIHRDSLTSLIDPGAMVVALWLSAFMFDRGLDNAYLVLSLMVFALAYPGNSRLHGSALETARDILLMWLPLFTLLLFFGWASGQLENFRMAAIWAWMVLAPAAMLGAHIVFRQIAPSLITTLGGRKRCVIAGLNEQGVALAQRITENPYSTMRLVGFFDDGINENPQYIRQYGLLGDMQELAGFCKRNRIHAIYLSLPMTRQPEIARLLNDLRDTTASIHFVPDIFITDLIQGRMGTVDGIPVVAVCESPFVGLAGLIKGFIDFSLSLVVLILISPLLAVIAAGVKLSSPGPVIFRQRRYGLDGEEIVVYKFRTMHVASEDSATVRQATRNDPRLTPLGAFLRRTSLDELPQFINVLQGRMSIVGPRPHAVSHNEQYRRIISGYMIRHKVKPGITGWAQVNGYRGETETVEKMEARILYDLDYLRNWSLWFDFLILFKTLQVVIRGDNAY